MQPCRLWTFCCSQFSCHRKLGVCSSFCSEQPPYTVTCVLVSWGMDFHTHWDHFCFSTVILIKINEAAIKTMYSYTLICIAVESRATGTSFSSGTQQQYNLALKSHFVIGLFQVLFLILFLNQTHHAQFSSTSSLLSCWYCNSELLLFTESQNHQHLKRPPRPSSLPVNPEPPKFPPKHFL